MPVQNREIFMEKKTFLWKKPGDPFIFAPSVEPENEFMFYFRARYSRFVIDRNQKLITIFRVTLSSFAHGSHHDHEVKIANEFDVFLPNRSKMNCSKSVFSGCQLRLGSQNWKIKNSKSNMAATSHCIFFFFQYHVRCSYMQRFLVVVEFRNTKWNIMDLLWRLYYLLKIKIFYLVSQAC